MAEAPAKPPPVPAAEKKAEKPEKEKAEKKDAKPAAGASAATRGGIKLFSGMGIGLLGVVALVTATAGFFIGRSFAGKVGATIDSAENKDLGETVELKDIEAVKQENLGALSRPKKVTMTVAIEVDKGPDGNKGRNKVRLDKAKDLMKDAIREVLETYTYDDMVSPQFGDTFKAHAKNKLNEQLGPNSVRRVFITKFNR
ncbi:MAG: flagellar basal body-associated FliL family protein [Planctomycetes bacterium]|nr:flagellar basal body-associated FliL family protein [Planctomycetota bacterium]